MIENMEKKASQLSGWLAQKLFDQQHRELDKFIENVQSLEMRLDQQNFLTNGGGAVAVLAFMGTQPTNGPGMGIPLVFFLIGVVATIIQTQLLILSNCSKHEQKDKILSQFWGDALTSGDCKKSLESVKVPTAMRIGIQCGNSLPQYTFVAGLTFGLARFYGLF